MILGHNRLSIVDLSETGAQPMKDNSGNWIISYNGELYNHNQLREELAKKFNVSFVGKSDTEVVLYSIKHFGIDEFLRKADGMFALAIYDKQSGDFYLARDRVGEKPVYFFKTKEGFCFGSELKGLTKMFDEELVVDEQGLQLYLLLRYAPAPHTILSGIKKLIPGHYIKFNQNDISVKQIPYYSWDPHASEIPATQENYNAVVEGTLKALVKSLESRLMSDVPFGFFSFWGC